MSEEKDLKLFDESEDVGDKPVKNKKAKPSKNPGEVELIEQVTALRKAKLEDANKELVAFLGKLDKDGLALSTLQFWRDGMPGPLQIECVFKPAGRNQ